MNLKSSSLGLHHISDERDKTKKKEMSLINPESQFRKKIKIKGKLWVSLLCMNFKTMKS